MTLAGIAIALNLFPSNEHQVTIDTHYFMAKLTYSLSLAGIFVFFALLYLVFDKISQRRYREWAGTLHFGLAFLGINLFSLPQHMFKLDEPPISVDGFSTNITIVMWLNNIGVILFLTSFAFFLGVIIHLIFLARRMAPDPRANVF